ncbi:MAG: MFS transporter [Sphingomicrobium sp.]
MTLLVLVYVVHAIDRGALVVVLEPIRREFGLSDSQAGALGGLVYGLAYALCCVPLGALVDRVNRRNLLAGLIAVWSAATLLAGFASSYVMLLLSRGAVGGAESGGGPSAISIVADYFGRERRASVYGLLYFGAGAGGAISAMLCGWLAGSYGWRVALFVAGGPGLLLALLLLRFLKEPVRGATERLPDGDAPGASEIFDFFWAQHSLMWIYIGVPAAGIAMSVVATWTIPFLMRSHGIGLGGAGLMVGLMLAIGVGASNLVSGLAADRFGRNSPVRRLAISTVCLVLTIPFAWAGYCATNLWVGIPLIFIAEALMSSVLAPVLGLIMNLSRPRMRGVAASTRDVLANSIGYGAGPWMAGLISVRLGGDANALRTAIIVTTIAGAAIAAGAFLMAMRTIVQDTARFAELN